MYLFLVNLVHSFLMARHRANVLNPNSITRSYKTRILTMYLNTNHILIAMVEIKITKFLGIEE